MITAEYYPNKLLLNKTIPATILDLGCDTSNSIDFFSNINTDIKWFGVDIEGSLEGKLRKRTDGNSAPMMRLTYLMLITFLTSSILIRSLYMYDTRMTCLKSISGFKTRWIFSGSVSYL